MHWIFLILALVAIALVSLGALSVWATVLFMALKTLLIAVPVGLVAILLWQWISNRRKS